jgi:hypothetical protein
MWFDTRMDADESRIRERLQVTSQLLRVATGVAAFAGHYAVAILVDSAHRD